LQLSEEGRAQAEEAAERIAALSPAPSAVYASPLERTRETAAPIARRLGLRVRTAHGLLECDIGDWAGQRLDRVSRRAEWRWVRRWPARFAFPGGESFVEMAHRAWAAVLDLADAHPGESIVAVSHADPIKAVAAMAAGTPIDLFQRLVVSPCSITALAFGAEAPTVLCMNSTGSLRELAPS
jgi:broad specificity phosphatase PhoE